MKQRRRGSARPTPRSRARRVVRDTALTSDERYRALFDRLPIGLYRSTPDGRLLEANPAMVQMLGYPDAATLRDAGALALYVDPDDRRRQVVERLSAGGIVRDLEVRWRRFDGSTMWTRNHVRAITAADGGILYEGAVEDITEARRTQEALDASRTLLLRAERLAVIGRLAGGISQELHNPLGVIKNAVYYLRMVVPNLEPARKHLGIIDREVATATGIVRDLLEFAHTTPPRRAPTDLTAVAREAIDRLVLPPRVELVARFADALPVVQVDAAQVLLVLSHLLRNALQAMPEGGTLTVETAPAGAGALVAVADTGTGIAPEHMAQLFEPLFTTRARGTGLGLAVCKSLADANAGEIHVESARGRGSRFAVRFAAGHPAP